MKRIKTFRMFESADVPPHFIELKSIGHYLDPESGYCYAMLKKGGYEDEPYPAEEYLDYEEEAWQALSDEEKSRVNSVWKSCESILKPAIDWDLIADIKDLMLAEEILDRGYHVRISVVCGAIDMLVYGEWYAHDKKNSEYARLFVSDSKELEGGDMDRCLEYIISVYGESSDRYAVLVPAAGDEVIEIVSRVKEMHPEKADMIKYEKW